MSSHKLTIYRFTIYLFICAFSFQANAQTCAKDLSLELILDNVKQNHPVIKSTILQNKISDSKLLTTQGAFDLNLKSNAYYNRYNSSTQPGEPQHANMYNTELELLTRYGIEINAGVDLNDGDIKTPYSPTGEKGEYFMSLNTPLFRGAGLNPSSVNEISARYNIEKVYNNYRLVSIELLLKAINSYWLWVTAQNKVKVEKQLLKNAEFRLDAIEKRSKSGDLASIDIIEAKQEIQRRKGRLLKAERDYQQKSYDLSWFLWDQNVQSTTNVLDCKSTDFTVNIFDNKTLNAKDGKLQALKNRPELKDIEISKKIANLEKDFATNDLLPQLDFFVRAGHQLGNDNINGVALKSGFEFELPIQRRDAKGRVIRFDLELNKLNYEQKNIMQRIFLQVDDSISAINMAIKRLSAAVEEVKLAQKMEAGENKRFKLGDSTLFVVNRRERATAEAKYRLIDTMFEYYQALGYYRAVTGSLI